jgi:hypothetical protein
VRSAVSESQTRKPDNDDTGRRVTTTRVLHDIHHKRQTTRNTHDTRTEHHPSCGEDSRVACAVTVQSCAVILAVCHRACLCFIDPLHPLALSLLVSSLLFACRVSIVVGVSPCLVPDEDAPTAQHRRQSHGRVHSGIQHPTTRSEAEVEGETRQSENMCTAWS